MKYLRIARAVESINRAPSCGKFVYVASSAVLLLATTFITVVASAALPDRDLGPRKRYDSCLGIRTDGNHSETYAKLHRRVENPGQRWEALREEGSRLLALCEADDSTLQSTDRTPWLNIRAPTDYGYVPVPPKDDAPFEGNEKGALRPLKAEGIDVEQEQDWVTLNWIHQKPTPLNDEAPKYPPTGAQFRFLIDEAASVLVAANSKTPDKVEHPLPAAERVPLRHWSDMAYLSWEILMYDKDARVKLMPPDRIIRLNIYTPQTSQAIAHVVRGQIKEYPGNFIDARSEEGLILMGTPHGKGVAYFLFQNKHFMGVWTVDRIQVWDSVGHVPDSQGHGRWPSMAFYFRPIVKTLKNIDGKYLTSNRQHGEGSAGEGSSGLGQGSSGEVGRLESPVPSEAGRVEQENTSVGQMGATGYGQGQGSSAPGQDRGKGKGPSKWQSFKAKFGNKKGGYSGSQQY